MKTSWQWWWNGGGVEGLGRGGFGETEGWKWGMKRIARAFLHQINNTNKIETKKIKIKNDEKHMQTGAQFTMVNKFHPTGFICGSYECVRWIWIAIEQQCHLILLISLNDCICGGMMMHVFMCTYVMWRWLLWLKNVLSRLVWWWWWWCLCVCMCEWEREQVNKRMSNHFRQNFNRIVYKSLYKLQLYKQCLPRPFIMPRKTILNWLDISFKMPYKRHAIHYGKRYECVCVCVFGLKWSARAPKLEGEREWARNPVHVNSVEWQNLSTNHSLIS